MKKRVLRILIPLLSFLLILTLASCGAASKDNVAESAPTIGEGSYGSNDKGFSGLTPTVDSSQVEDRKVIKTYNVNAETKTYDEAITALDALVASVGGYVESSSSHNKSMNNSSDLYTRYASYTLRIPAENADAFVASLGEQLYVTSSNATAEDVSETYYSIAARLEELQVERDALLDMLSDDATKKDYGFWMTVRERLSEVTQQIAVYQGQINRYDGKIAYSTVELSIREVLTYSVLEQSRGFGSRLGNAFSDGWSNFVFGLQDFILWFAEALPTLILLALIVTAIVFIIRAIRRKKKRTQSKEPSVDK